ncbi:uncharacterized protein LOC106644786 [Copidosoma floridanum]|uniref:uncharacterized protein LOC106644786 n=1 Tax=Copidosoma floridanum TaxID=29053 RepID=UPI0006C96BD1|nr:uncharacterized protein LOC106644786 [Copidosoma floridanum]
MDKLHRSQTKLTTNITNFYDNSTVKVAVEKQTLSHFETRLGILENYWSTFISRHEDLLEYEEQLASDSYFKDDGKQEEWESFKQHFSSLVVSKATVPPIAKLQHLLNAVQGAAAQRLKGIELTDANFQVAWTKLTRRYDNPRVRLFNGIENLIQLPAVKARNEADLNETMDRAEKSVRALIDLGCPIEQTNYFVVHCVIRKLDLTSREAWEVLQERTVGFPSYADLTTFLERRIHALEQAHVGPQSSDAGKANLASKQSGDRFKRVVANAVQTDESARTTKSCVACKGNHYVNRCRDFKSMPVSQRWDLCKRERLCVNCLRASYFVEKCPSPNRCVTCDAKHHSKLHFERIAKPRNEEVSSRASAPRKDDNPSDEPASPPVAAHNALVGRTILLATAELIAIGPNGKRLRIRALVDPGAKRSFITHSVISELGLLCSSVNIKVVGVGGSASSTAHRKAELKVAPRGESNLTISVSALVLPKLSQPLPHKHAVTSELPHNRGLKLADPQFFESRQIDCILGADVYPSVIQDGTKRGPAGAPLAQNSAFGWLLTGPLASVDTSNTMHVRASHIHTDNLLAVELQKFWEIEEAPRKSLLTSDERKCEESFHETFFRNADGRFVVKLPFQSTPKFFASRDIATACFIRSEKRRHRDSDLAESYGSFMQDYIDQRHMEPVPSDEISRPSFYLPHHAVRRSENPSKVRVVFNASQKDSNGVSLNDLLLAGPKIQADITQVLTMWRFFKFVFTTDVVQMFRQILVHLDDRDWQRVLWRSSAVEPIMDYRCTTITYGTASAPYLALKVMQTLTTDGAETHPHAAETLRRRLYVDDLFAGADTLDQARQQRDETIQLLSSAGMALGKWASNNSFILEGLEAMAAKAINLKQDDAVSTLGLQWLPSSDSFSFKQKGMLVGHEITKRVVLSEIARLFDPFCWIAPIIVSAKIVLQDIWLLSHEWDELLPNDLQSR